METMLVAVVIHGCILGEYLILLLIMSLYVRRCYRKGSHVEGSYIGLLLGVGVLVCSRAGLVAFTGLELENSWGGIMMCIRYTGCFVVYSMILNQWFNIYIMNILHMFVECRDMVIQKINKVLIVLDVMAFICLVCISILILTGGINVSKSSEPALYIYHLVLMLINYATLLPMGLLLLKQIRKYADSKPLVLIISTYFTLFGLGLAILCIISLLAGYAAISSILK